MDLHLKEITPKRLVLYKSTIEHYTAPQQHLFVPYLTNPHQLVNVNKKYTSKT